MKVFIEEYGDVLITLVYGSAIISIFSMILELVQS